MKYFKRKLVGKARHEAEWREALRAYNAHLQHVKERLPASARAFSDRERFHDAVLLNDVKVDGDAIRLEFYDGIITLSGVRTFFSSGPLKGDVWLYSELDVAPSNRFVLRVLLEEYEFEAIASEVSLFDKQNNSWLVPPVTRDDDETTMKSRRSKRRRS